LYQSVIPHSHKRRHLLFRVNLVKFRIFESQPETRCAFRTGNIKRCPKVSLYISTPILYILPVFPPILYDFILISKESFVETTSSLTKIVFVLRWVARIFGTILVLFILSQFLGAIIRTGHINVIHYGHYVMMVFFGLAQIGILIAWRWEGIGGFLGVFGVIATILLNSLWVDGPRMAQSNIAFLLWLIPSLLFIYCWWKTRGES